ncbi:MAG: hypothetical protein JW861_00595 [Bacteroidales bacterium]|nr:hypothetical protein [Bacteroidales bacterium]
MDLVFNVANPVVYIVLSLILGFAAAFLLYFRDRRSGLSIGRRRVLSILRFLAVTIISLLILDPMIRIRHGRSEPPLILFAIDNSSSVVANKDSSWYREAFTKKIGEMSEYLAASYDLRFFTFGTRVIRDGTVEFNEEATDMSNLFRELENRFSNRNVGALILATDGLFNRGVNPLYTTGGIRFPVYTLALGDSSIQKDLVLEKVNYNRIAYLGNEFPVEVIIRAEECSGETSSLTILTEGKPVAESKLGVTKDHYLARETFMLHADKPGMNRYSVRLAAVEGEIGLANNSMDIYIDVLDSRQKVLLLYHSPHPDVSAIRQSLLAHLNYEVDVYAADRFSGSLKGVNLLVLHQLPAGDRPLASVFREAGVLGIPMLVIIGPRSDLGLFNEMGSGMRIEGGRVAWNEALPSFDEGFGLFSVDESILHLIKSFPPLVSPFGNYRATSSPHVLFRQRIGNVVTEDPLVIFTQKDDTRYGTIAGEGIWKWRLHNFKADGTHDAFDDILQRTVQYLSLVVDKGFFRVVSRNRFNEDEAVEFSAELYNPSYEPVNDPEVYMKITDRKGNNFPYVFSPTSQSYYLNAGYLPPGQYRYEASVSYNGMAYKESGEFVISPLQMEMVRTTADHQLLFQLSDKTGGRMFYPHETGLLIETMKSRDDIRPVVYQEERFSQILGVWWLLGVIFSLMFSEWIIRRYSGSV